MATLLERVNNKKFKVNFQKLFLLYLWVLICVEVGKSNADSEVKCQSSCFSENFAVAGKVLRKQKGILVLTWHFYGLVLCMGPTKRKKKISIHAKGTLGPGPCLLRWRILMESPSKALHLIGYFFGKKAGFKGSLHPLPQLYLLWSAERKTQSEKRVRVIYQRIA